MAFKTWQVKAGFDRLYPLHGRHTAVTNVYRASRDLFLARRFARHLREIAKGGRTGDVFLPDALIPKLKQFWGYKRRSKTPQSMPFLGWEGRKLAA